jgi:hypothetical protein
VDLRSLITRRPPYLGPVQLTFVGQGFADLTGQVARSALTVIIQSESVSAGYRLSLNLCCDVSPNGTAYGRA